METKQRHALAIGFAVGLALFAFFYYETRNPVCLILIPIAAVMGVAPQYLKPKDFDEDE